MLIAINEGGEGGLWNMNRILPKALVLFSLKFAYVSLEPLNKGDTSFVSLVERLSLSWRIIAMGRDLDQCPFLGGCPYLGGSSIGGSTSFRCL